MYNSPIANPWHLFLAVAHFCKRILLHSEDPGTGKTSAGIMLADALGYACTVLTLTDSMTASDLLGHWVPKGQEFIWHDGPLARAIRNGRTVIVLNELPNAGPDVSHVLYAALEAGKSAEFTLPNNEVLRIPETLVFIGTQNPQPEDTMTPAVLQRWQVRIDIGNHVSPMILDALPTSLRSMVADHRMTSREAFSILELTAAGCDTMLAIQAVLGTSRSADYGDALAIALSTGNPCDLNDTDDTDDGDDTDDSDDSDSDWDDGDDD